MNRAKAAERKKERDKKWKKEVENKNAEVTRQPKINEFATFVVQGYRNKKNTHHSHKLANQHGPPKFRLVVFHFPFFACVTFP